MNFLSSLWQKNRYVDFVSDEHFLKCVRKVCESYPKDKSKVELTKHALDPLKMVFDMVNHDIDINEWISAEKVRRTDKTVNNRIGNFHQDLLGGVSGWEDLGRGHKLGIDIKKKDNSILMELKNRYNTVKGEDLKHVFDKLKRASAKHPKAVVYYAYVTPAKPSSGEKVWKTSQRDPDKKIREAWGLRVYEIVTGDKESLKKTFQALPIAIQDTLKRKNNLKGKELETVRMAFEKTFIS